ncbi:MAG: homocysteine S-methyltransferase family protein, partial [Kiritimatiellia bacterium]|nr:homocysteine S-methyltransferase family protein [Kiritimatiellia bacterium]
MIVSRNLPPLLFFDGAMGTALQEKTIPQEAWKGLEGCNEILTLTLPDTLRAIHRAYLDAGCDAIETNTFGASPITLSEYGIADRATEINRAAARLARECAAAAATPDRPRFVFGSVGPGTRLPSLGQTDYNTLHKALSVQIEALSEGGVDGLLIETCQDPLQIKAGLGAFESVWGNRAGTRPILYVSVTVEQTGTLLIGSSIAAIAAILAPFPIDILGLNCATGPEAMRIHLDALARSWPGRIGCMPNAGLPVLEGTNVRYPLQPEPFADAVAGLARELQLNAVGGCCGTTPAHLRARRERLEGWAPTPRGVESAPEQAASLFLPVDLTQQPAPLFIGERANATGSKAFREALLREDLDGAFQILIAQEETGAHVLDLSCAYAGRDELRDMTALVDRAARELRTPLMIDTTQADVLEAALQRIGGRAIVNSINFEDGEKRADRVARMARRFGAAVIGLTIDEQGMAMTADRKVAIAKRLVTFCGERGLRPGDLLIDPLTFTLGSGDETLRTAALETIEAIRRIRAELPGVRTLLGLSNISFGLKPAARRALNAVFLDQALKAGLD